MSPPSARTLLEGLGLAPGTLEQLADDEDLLEAGVTSGEVIRLTLAIEEALEVELSVEEVEALVSLRDADELIRRRLAGSKADAAD